jgi:hypothetical protein
VRAIWRARPFPPARGNALAERAVMAGLVAQIVAARFFALFFPTNLTMCPCNHYLC